MVHPHMGYQLTRYCADPRVHHLWMLVPRTAAGSAFEDARDRILTLFQRSANLQLAGLLDTESNLALSRLTSPAAGGFGFTDPNILADAAWVASWVATAPWLRTFTGLDRLGKPRVPLEEGEDHSHVPRSIQTVGTYVSTRKRAAWYARFVPIPFAHPPRRPCSRRITLGHR